MIGRVEKLHALIRVTFLGHNSRRIDIAAITGDRSEVVSRL